MTKSELEQKLSLLIRTDGGQDQIIQMYMDEVLGFGVLPQVGMLVSQMAKAIVEKRFPSASKLGP